MKIFTLKTNLPPKKSENYKENLVFQKLKREGHENSQPLGENIDTLQSAGNQEVQRLMKSGKIQAKLKISDPNDEYEKEADRVAEHVVNMPDSRISRQTDKEEDDMIQTKSIAETITPLVQRQTESDENEDIVQPKLKEIVQRKTEEDEEMIQSKLNKTIQKQSEDDEEELIQGKLNNREGARETSPGIETQINSMKGGGQPLSKEARDYFEPRFGVDFGDVRIHNNTESTQVNDSINSKAFTVGNNIFANEKDNINNDRLLAHELTHVIQQNGILGRRIVRSIDNINLMHTTQVNHIQRKQNDSDYHLPDPTRYQDFSSWIKALYPKVESTIPIEWLLLPDDEFTAKMVKHVIPLHSKKIKPNKENYIQFLFQILIHSGDTEEDIQARFPRERQIPTEALPEDMVKDINILKRKKVKRGEDMVPFFIDCIDMALFLRHFFYMKKNIKRSIEFVPSPKKGRKKESRIFYIGKGVHINDIFKLLKAIRTRSVWVNPLDAPIQFYGGNEAPEKNLRVLIEKYKLEPGDVFMWQPQSGIKKARHGHAHTIQRIDKNNKLIAVLQGHMKPRGNALWHDVFTFFELTGDENGNGEIKWKPGFHREDPNFILSPEDENLKKGEEKSEREITPIQKKRFESNVEFLGAGKWKFKQ